MLEQLTIDQIAIIEHSEIPFRPGYNVLTGETGAGKSILIDALGLVLGERADASSIRHGQARATVSATFSELSSAHQQALAEDGLDDPDNPGQIHIRRTLRDGGSKAWVNDQSVTGSKLKTLAATLVNIHGQHHNQALLKNDEQRRRLDRYANHRELLTACANAYRHWQHLEKEREAWQTARTSDEVILDLRDLSLYPDLRGLSITTNFNLIQVRDLDALYRLKNLETLSINTEKIHKFEIDVSKITVLKELVLDGYKPGVYNIGKAKQLEVLVLYGYKNSDLSEFADLLNLRDLRLFYSEIKSLDGIENMTKLEHLEIAWAKNLQDISALDRLEQKHEISGVLLPKKFKRKK